MNSKEALSTLESIHNYFHTHCRPFYDKDVLQADMLICVAMSDLRHPDLKPLLPTLLRRY